MRLPRNLLEPPAEGIAEAAHIPRGTGQGSERPASPFEDALRHLAARMLEDARDVEEAVGHCLARRDASPRPGEDQKGFARRMFRAIIDEALVIQRQRKRRAVPRGMSR